MEREPLTVEQEAVALGYDPWGERDATYVVLSNKFVTTRKPLECSICFEAIPSGSRVRAQREVDYGKAKTFRFCAECSWLMAHRHDEPGEPDGNGDCDNFERLVTRYDIGRRNAEARRGGQPPTGGQP